MAEKIEMGKVYRTRDGREVRIYAVDGSPNCPVHGAIHDAAGWSPCHWSDRGIYWLSEGRNADLIEQKPKITRTYWLAHGYDGTAASYWDTRGHPEEDARALAKANPTVICAITGPHTVEFEEGQGL